MSQGQIVLVFDERDKHLNLLSPHFDLEPVVIEPASIPRGMEISYLHDGHDDVLFVGHHELRTVSAVMWRKMMELATEHLPLDHIDVQAHDYVKRSVRRHADQLGSWFGDDVLWVSNPYAMSRAGNKAWQVRLAAKAEFAVPRTLQTSSLECARQFVHGEWERGGEVIVKSLANHFPRTADEIDQMFWSQKVRRTQRFDGLTLAPAIFQQFVSGTNLRVTVVGEEVFAARIVPKIPLPDNIPDYRIVGQGIQGNLAIDPYVLPESVVAACIRLLHDLELSYGAFDFIVDHSGTYWYLETNAMGAWGFVELATGQPISKAIARFLASA